jgi:RND superfamily putative drug exporter
MPPRADTSPASPARHARRTTSVPWRLSRWGAVVVALLPLLLAGLAIGALGEGERDRQTTDSLPTGYDSTEAAELRDRLPDGDTSVAIVLFTADQGKLTQTQLGALQKQVQDLTGGQSGSGLIPSEDGTAALTTLPIDAPSSTAVADGVTELRKQLDSDVPDGVTAEVTGPAGIEADLASVFDGANTRLLLVTGTVVAVLLIITYRSPVLWVIPLLVVGVADRFATIAATQVMAALDVAWDESTTGILSVLVFGAGTDYALLLISRYRDELRRTSDRWAARAVAARRTAEPVLSSATTVVVGVLTLLLSLIPTTRGLGVASAVGITVAAFFVMVCLPSLLVVFGRWVFWPRVPHEGEATLDESRSAWRRVADRVAARPAMISLVVVGLLAAMAVGVFHIRTGLDEADQFLQKPEAISASERIAESYPAGLANPTLVLTTSDEVKAIQSAAEGVDGVAQVRRGDSGNGVTELDVVLDGGSGSAQAERSIAGLRTALAEFPDTHVGGPEAETIDGRDAAARDRMLIFPIILGLVLVALVLLLRSIVAPLVLVATVVATYLAALGVSWWLFTGPLGFSAIDQGAPLFAFLFLVALGVDYNIFLVTRALEETRGHGSREGMLRALAATGGVITSAGILLAAVFAALGVLPLVVLAQIGTIICIGVLLDTLVVRTLLVPALAVMLGDRFWWPRRFEAPR